MATDYNRGYREKKSQMLKVDGRISRVGVGRVRIVLQELFTQDSAHSRQMRLDIKILGTGRSAKNILL